MLAFALGGIQFYNKWFEHNATVPFCGWASWLDCDTVLSHPKWSVWMGGSVSGLAVMVYVFAIMLPLCVIRGDVGQPTKVWRRRAWLTLYGGSVIIVLSAAWFVGLQFFVIGKLCWICLLEHALGVGVSVMIWRRGAGVFGSMRSACATTRMVGVFLVGVLVGGQVVYEPVYTRQLTPWTLDEAGRYVETGAPNESVEVAGGRAVL
ncbi:MAG: vitamin K epoxide reductase family protein, partial [Planctomycetota bacterium]